MFSQFLERFFSPQPEFGSTDADKRAALYDFAAAYRHEHGVFPLLTLEQFFEGNHDADSIGVNLWRHPGMAKFYAVLSAIRAHDDVYDVRVIVHESAADSFEATWLFADTVMVITRAHPNVIRSQIRPLQPETINIHPSDVRAFAARYGKRRFDKTPWRNLYPELQAVPAGYEILLVRWE